MVTDYEYQHFSHCWGLADRAPFLPCPVSRDHLPCPRLSHSKVARPRAQDFVRGQSRAALERGPRVAETHENCQFTFEDSRGHFWNSYLKFNQCENCENFGSAYQTDFFFITVCLMLSTFCLMILHWLTVHDALRRWIYRALSALQYGFWAARGQGIQLAVYSLEIFILPGYATCHLTLSFHLTTIYRIVTIVGSTRRARDSSFTSLFIAIDQPTHSEYAELSREGKPFHTLYPKGR